MFMICPNSKGTEMAGCLKKIIVAQYTHTSIFLERRFDGIIPAVYDSEFPRYDSYECTYLEGNTVYNGTCIFHKGN